MSVATAATASFAVLIKEAMVNMPDSLNTKKEIDEYYKKVMKEINDKMKEDKKALKKAEPKEPKEPKKRVKKTKPAEVDEDGNEIVKVKKPLNKYQMFIQQQRPKVKEDYPELSGEEIFTKIAELWKQHKEGADNKSDEKEIKKIDSDSEDIKKIDEEIKKIDSDDDKASDANASESGNESEAEDAGEADDADDAEPVADEDVAVVATTTPAPVVVPAEDKKAKPTEGKAPRKALSTKPAKSAKK
uniref:HMG box domain-containing protein n=1 Tax=viral metagenome TaxID=1070528 RepID=A0A6C0KAD2_9ZZZZ